MIRTRLCKLIAFEGVIFDVTGNKAYGPDGSYKGACDEDAFFLVTAAWTVY